MKAPLSTTFARQLTLPATDVFSEWFSALEAEGECLRFRLGRSADEGADPEWYFLPHQDHDGIGGLQRVLAERHGIRLTLPRLAEPYPSRWRQVAAAIRVALRRPSDPLTFRDLDPDWRGDRERPEPPTAFAWALLGERDTEALRGAAHALGISFTALLLWGLTQATLPHLTREGSCIDWIVPINMRGTRPELPDTANQAATLDVAFSPGASPAQVDAALRRERRQQAHFGVWALLELLALLGGKWVRRIAQREARIRKHGSFSNLGRLHLARPSLTDPGREFWMAFNPVLKSRPVGAACLTYEGRLALTLQLHPALSRDPGLAHAWLLGWIRALSRSADQQAPEIHAR